MTTTEPAVGWPTEVTVTTTAGFEPMFDIASSCAAVYVGMVRPAVLALTPEAYDVSPVEVPAVSVAEVALLYAVVTSQRMLVICEPTGRLKVRFWTSVPSKASVAD